MSFDGNVASVQNSAGETVAQTVIQDTDKVNPSQPVGQPAQEATTNNVVTDNTQTGNVEAAPSTPEQTPVQPDNGSQGGQTTPSTPENNQPSTPENGGTTTPEQPSQPGGGNQGGSNGGTTTPEKPETPQEPTPDQDPVGRISPWFMTAEEADAWAEKLPDDQYNRASRFGTTFSDGTMRYCIVLN